MNRCLPIALLLFSVACTDAPPADAPDTSDEAASAPAEVIIESPSEGADIDGAVVEVVLGVQNLTIVPAGDQQPNSGHHHLFLDADVSPAGEPIPAEPNRIIHMGDGSSTYQFENVPAGEHRLIAVIGDWQHVPLVPNVADTVMFTVR